MMHRNVVVVVVLLGSLIGCAGSRPAKSQADLLALRDKNDQQLVTEGQTLFHRILEHAKAKSDAAKAKSQPATLDFLIISGGGDWGAFGAGVLKGWGTIQTGEMTRPQFDIVTGVSTGALIAPFAFVGTDESIERVNNLYRNPKKDWVKQRWPLYFLPTNISFAEVPGLERELKENVDMEIVSSIANDSKTGRVVVMNTTNVDDGTMHVWDVGMESERAVRENNLDRVHTIMLASSGIPAAFPYREIDGEMYVDGGITGNILYGGRMKETDTLPAMWQKAYPDTPMPKIRYWIIFNNQIRPLPQVTAPTWTAIVSRSLEMGTRSATVTSMRHLFAMSEIAKLKHNADIEIRIMAVPGDWVPPKPGIFIKETMNALADMGEKMGADPSSWQTEVPR